MSHSILVVDADPTARAATVGLLNGGGHLIRVADSFEQGRTMLETAVPDLLVVDVRLGEYNGLQMVLRGRVDHPEMQAIVTGFPDTVLEAEARHAGAAYFVKPLPAPEFLAFVTETLTGTLRPRRWPRKQLAGAIEASIANAMATVVDMSYGGLCFELKPPGDDPAGATVQLPSLMTVDLPSVGLSVRVEPVWTTRPETTGPVVCGAAITEGNPRRLSAWRRVVDSVTA